MTFHDLNVIHDGIDLRGPLRLRLSSSSPRFITRYNALREQISSLTLGLEDEVEASYAEGATEVADNVEPTGTPWMITLTCCRADTDVDEYETRETYEDADAEDQVYHGDTTDHGYYHGPDDDLSPDEPVGQDGQLQRYDQDETAETDESAIPIPAAGSTSEIAERATSPSPEELDNFSQAIEKIHSTLAAEHGNTAEEATEDTDANEAHEDKTVDPSVGGADAARNDDEGGEPLVGDVGVHNPGESAHDVAGTSTLPAEVTAVDDDELEYFDGTFQFVSCQSITDDRITSADSEATYDEPSNLPTSLATGQHEGRCSISPAVDPDTNMCTSQTIMKCQITSQKKMAQYPK